MAGAEGDAWPLGEIAAGVGMHPATVHRVLGQLVEDGLVRQAPGTGAYGLGLEFLRLAGLAPGRASLRAAAQPARRAGTAGTGGAAPLRRGEPGPRDGGSAPPVGAGAPPPRRPP